MKSVLQDKMPLPKPPNSFIFFDTETRRVKGSSVLVPNVSRGAHIHQQSLWFGCLEAVRVGSDGMPLKDWPPVEHTFYTANQFWDFVEDWVAPQESCDIICHNLDFDAFCIDLANREINFSRSFVEPGGPKLWVVNMGKGRTVRLLDNLNWFAASVKKLGNDLDLKKLENPDMDGGGTPPVHDGSLPTDAHIEYSRGMLKSYAAISSSS